MAVGWQGRPVNQMSLDSAMQRLRDQLIGSGLFCALPARHRVRTRVIASRQARLRRCPGAGPTM